MKKNKDEYMKNYLDMMDKLPMIFNHESWELKIEDVYITDYLKYCSEIDVIPNYEHFEAYELNNDRSKKLKEILDEI